MSDHTTVVIWVIKIFLLHNILKALGFQDGEVEGSVLIFCKNSKLQLAEQPSAENIGSHQNKISRIQGQRRSPRKTVERVKLHLESNPIPARDTQRAQTKYYVHQDPETP